MFIGRTQLAALRAERDQACEAAKAAAEWMHWWSSEHPIESTNEYFDMVWGHLAPYYGEAKEDV